MGREEGEMVNPDIAAMTSHWQGKEAAWEGNQVGKGSMQSGVEVTREKVTHIQRK